VLTENGVKIGKHLSEKINEILSIASEGLSEEKRNIMYEGLSLINNRLNKICDEYENN
jgi:hypothetical protein